MEPRHSTPMHLRRFWGVQAVPVVMSDKHGFLGISAAAYYRVRRAS